MDEIVIVDAGCVSALGDSTEACFENMGGDVNFETQYDFEVSMPPKLKRSSDRFSKMYVTVMDKMVQRNEEELNKYPKERIGTIFSSEYGPVTTNLLFAREVLEKDPEICSPAKFSNTVANACVGIACLNYGYKGVSTMLQGSNSFSFSADLLNEGKADLIFSGYADEYNEEVARALRDVAESPRQFSENSVVFLLGNKDFEGKSICRIKNISCINFGSEPQKDKEKNSARIIRCIERCLKDNKPVDAVIYTADDTEIGAFESNIIKEYFKNNVALGKTRPFVGDVLGSNLNMNIFLGVTALKKKQLNDKLFDGVNGSCKRILVTGYDIVGNYSCILLEAE